MGVSDIAWVVVVAALAMGCGSDDVSDDGGTHEDGGGGAGIAPPGIPWLLGGVPPISLTPCPDGWREHVDDDVASCHPYPEGGAVECPAGQMHFAGEPDCAPVGVPCPAGDFADDLPSDTRVVYVQPGASGDGSATAPYGSVSEFSLGGLPIGSVIALSRGLHERPLRLSREHVLRGACAGLTEIRVLTPADTEGVVTLTNGARGTLRDLTIANSPRAGVWLENAGSEARLEGVIVTGMRAAAGILTADGAHLSAETVVIRDTASQRPGGPFGVGLNVVLLATAEVHRAVVVGNRDTGVTVQEAEASLTDLVVRDTESQASDGMRGRGVNVQFESTLVLRRALLSNNREVGLFAAGDGTALTMEAVVIRDTRGRMLDDGGGAGLSVEHGAVAQVDRARIERNHAVGVLGNAGTMMSLADLVVRDTESRLNDGLAGHGLFAEDGATVALTRGVLSRNRGAGLVATVLGTTLTVVDVLVSDTGGQSSDGMGGRGLAVQDGAMGSLRRALLSNNRQIGVSVVGEGSALTLEDVVVHGNQVQTSDGRFGRAIGVERGSTATVSRALLRDNHEFGVLVSAAEAVLDDIVVSGTRTRACMGDGCTTGGIGIGSYGSGARLQMSRFSVEESATCGVWVAAGAGLDLEDGSVTGSPIGACVQVSDYDTDRLSFGVRFVDNVTNLQSISLPVPDAADPTPTP